MVSMDWSITYGIYYPDAVRHGHSRGYGLENCLDWIRYARKDIDCLYVRIWRGPKIVKEWIRDMR